MDLIQHTIETPYMVGPVHCYSGYRDHGLVLFDTGPPTPGGRQFLLDHLDLRSLRHVLVTHCHLDHYGQAHWLAKHTDATIYLPYNDHLKRIRHRQRMDAMFALLGGMGFPAPYLAALKESMHTGTMAPPYPDQYRIAETDLPAHLGVEVLHCPGHTQSDLAYVVDNQVVTGDILLRGIFQSPLLDVDLNSGERFNNYAAYCASIGTLSTLRGNTILPGHRHSVDSVDAGLLFYVGKMLDRVSQLKPYCNLDSVAEIMATMFTALKQPFHIYLKASEVVFMLDFLENPQLLRAALEACDLFAPLAQTYERVIQADQTWTRDNE